jgi:2,3-bisphosphoglycerate-independent phosphoglycerate mutase
MPPEDTHFALFGYEMRDLPGRGAVEALGAGIDLHPGDYEPFTVKRGE